MGSNASSMAGGVVSGSVGRVSVELPLAGELEEDEEVDELDDNDGVES